jgi:hypothetical protein
MNMMIMFIIIDKTAFFQPSSEDSVPRYVYFVRLLDHPVCTPLNFVTINFTEQGRQPCAQPPPNLEDQVSLFISPSDRMAQLYPRAPGSFFVAFYDSQGYGGGILTRLHTGSDNISNPKQCI